MKNFFGVFCLTLPFLHGCVVVDFERDPIKFECDNRGCEARTNILVCTENNTHCEYIDVPVIFDNLDVKVDTYTLIDDIGKKND